MKKIYSLTLLLMAVMYSSAEEYHGYCGADNEGTNLEWFLNTADSSLIISGSGQMENYDNASNVPWYAYRAEIKTVNIADGVTSIGDNVFDTYPNITTATIANSVLSIGAYAFTSCPKLSIVTLPENLITIHQCAFNSCTALQTPTLPETLTTIGGQVFYQCHQFSSIEIPRNVSSIGEQAFSNCSQLTAIHVAEQNTAYVDIDGVLYTKDTSTLVVCPAGIPLMNYEIPTEVAAIASGAFYGCKQFTSISIPHTVTSIGSDAFHYCQQLVSITFPDNLTTIWPNTCSNCTNLKSVHLPTNATSIKDAAFNVCSSLTEIHIPEKVTSLGWFSFGNCPDLDTVYCDAPTPPTLDVQAFEGISEQAVLVVRFACLASYQADETFTNSFAEITSYSIPSEISAATASIKWLPDTAAAEYIISVSTADTLYQQYQVDSTGDVVTQLKLPALRPMPQKKDTTISSTDYFVITLGGLTASTLYTYTIEGKNRMNELVYLEQGSFQTKDIGEGVSDATAEEPRRARKTVRNGQLLILREEKTYTVQGQEVKY